MPRPSAAAVAATAAGAARLVPGVVDLDAGPLGNKVTYGSGGRVTGVTVHERDGARCVGLHLRVAWAPVLPIADAAQAAALDALSAAYPSEGPWRVDVEVADIVAPAGAVAPAGGVTPAGGVAPGPSR